MIYYCDIDNTICTTIGSNYKDSTPLRGRIQYMNDLYDTGHEVHYWTARGGHSGTDWLKFTEEQLKYWGVQYTSVNTGKPSYDIFIDDKAFNDKEFFNDYCDGK